MRFEEALYAYMKVKSNQWKNSFGGCPQCANGGVCTAPDRYCKCPNNHFIGSTCSRCNPWWESSGCSSYPKFQVAQPSPNFPVSGAREAGMTPIETTRCFLTMYQWYGVDDRNYGAGCIILERSGSYILRSETYNTQKVWTQCAASCIPIVGGGSIQQFTLLS